MWITLSAGEDCFLARGYDTFLISGFSGLDPMKYTPPPPPKQNDQCTCGHAFSEHVQAGASHGCQHGSTPPYTNECSCKSFKQKKRSSAVETKAS
jgi:hypothetical protein